MAGTCVIGLQWGDEAKGKLVDLLAPQFDLVVRYQGGANAGHTVHAPVWPGYGPLENEGSIEDMLDFALLGWDIVDALGLDAAPRELRQVARVLTDEDIPLMALKGLAYLVADLPPAAVLTAEFDPLRDDERFVDLTRRMGWPTP